MGNSRSLVIFESIQCSTSFRIPAFFIYQPNTHISSTVSLWVCPINLILHFISFSLDHGLGERNKKKKRQIIFSLLQKHFGYQMKHWEINCLNVLFHLCVFTVLKSTQVPGLFIVVLFKTHHSRCFWECLSSKSFLDNSQMVPVHATSSSIILLI